MNKEGLYARSVLDSDGFGDFITDLGGNPLALMHEAGLNTTPQKGKIQFVSWNAMARYFELAAKRLDEPYLGLKWARAMPKDYRSSGPKLFLANSAPSIRELIKLVIKYQMIHTNGVRYSYVDDIAANELIGTISIHPLSVPCRQYTEQIMGGIVVMTRRYLPHVEFKRIAFQHSAPEDIKHYEDVFQCRIEFNADKNMIVIDREVVDDDKPSGFFSLISPFLKTYLKMQLKHVPEGEQTIRYELAAILPTIMGAGNSDIAQVAATMDMHPKKLQRLLRDEGTSYSEVLAEVRKNLAKGLLEESDISITRIAKMLDYSTDRAFATATKRWFGMAPTAYRADVRRSE